MSHVKNNAKDLVDGEFEFDGFNSYSDMGLYLNHVNKPLSGAISNSRISVPGKYGDINLGNGYGAKTFTLSCQFIAITNAKYNEMVHNLAAYLIRRNDDGAEYELKLGDEPDVSYYGTFTSLPELTQVEEGVNSGKFDLVFTCSDPKGYLPTLTRRATTEPYLVNPGGTGEAYPIYEFELKKDAYEIGISHGGDGYVDIGYSVEDDNVVVDKEPVIVSDPCNTLATWTNLTVVPFAIVGDIDGKFQSNADSISVKKDTKAGSMYQYGTTGTHKDFYGPMIIHEGLSKSVTDFDLKFRMHHAKNYHRGISKSEVYLVDSNNKNIGRIYIQDAKQGMASFCSVYLGSGTQKKLYHGWYEWKNGANYTDKITITKKGSKTTTTGKGKKKKSKTTVTYPKSTDKIEDFNNTSYFNESFVQFHFRKVGTTVVMDIQEVNDNGSLKNKYIVKNKSYILSEKQDFNLATIAYHAAKRDITEDKINPKTKKPTKLYNYGWNSITSYTVKEILAVDVVEPQIIGHKGDTIIANFETKHVDLVSASGDVKPLDKYVSFGSMFPPLKGGVSTSIGFSPSLADANVTIKFRPTYL